MGQLGLEDNCPAGMPFSAPACRVQENSRHFLCPSRMLPSLSESGLQNFVKHLTFIYMMRKRFHIHVGVI